MIRTDAERLYQSQDWNTTSSPRYKSRKQAARHAERDGLAFAAVSLPPRYSVIYRVLFDLRWRLGREHIIERVMEWGGGLGSGAWAALNVFKRHESYNPTASLEEEMNEGRLEDSSVKQYWSFDKNLGMIAAGKKLLQGEWPLLYELCDGINRIYKGINHSTSVFFQGAPRPGEEIPPGEGGDAIAITAFTLSNIRDPLLRKEQVKQMWLAGTDIIVRPISVAIALSS